jgi:hypothetical protein
VVGPASTGAFYLEHLTDEDLRLLAGLVGSAREPDRAKAPSTGVAVPGLEEAAAARAPELRGRPDLVEALVAAPGAFEAVLGPDQDPFLRASPFLVFALAVHRATHELAGASFVHEWLGPRQRVAVFDVEPLRRFLADPMRRLFLVELLASYTHVASGSVWVRTGRGWRRQRFSELDPVRLADLLEVVPEAERPGVYRRLGDLALFLTGVFPDHTAARRLSSVAAHRLLAAAQLDEPPEQSGSELPTAVADPGLVPLLEELGRRWYRLAGAAAPIATGTLRIVSEVASQFRAARRVLNFVTDRSLFAVRERFFPAA